MEAGAAFDSERGDRHPRLGTGPTPDTHPESPPHHLTARFKKQRGEGTPRADSRATYLPLSSAMLGRGRDMSWLLVTGAGRVYKGKAGEEGSGIVRMAPQHQEPAWSWHPEAQPQALGLHLMGKAFQWPGQATPRD